MPSRHLTLSFSSPGFRIGAQHGAPSTHSPKKYVVLPTTAAAFGIVAVLALLFVCWYRKFLKQRSNKTSPDDGAAFKLHRFKYRHLKRATKSFSQSQKLGKGGFGMVYRGVLRNGKEIAVKKLDLASSQGEREFQNELSICGGLNSPYVVSLLGYCTHGRRVRLLVYECMQNRSLQEALFEKGYPVHLDWSKRFKIVLDTARALEFLHLECSPPIIHGDVKPSNILLDSQFSARIADFGLARLKSEEFWVDNARMSTFSDKFRSDTPDRFRGDAPDRLSLGTPDRWAVGTPEMSRSSTRNAFSELVVKGAAEPPDERKKLRAEKPVVIDIHPMEAPRDHEDVLGVDMLSFSPALAQPTGSQDVALPVDVIQEYEDAKETTQAPKGAEDSDDGRAKAHPVEGRTTDVVSSGDRPNELPFPPLDRQASHKRKVAGGELTDKDYVIDWIGSELRVRKDEEILPELRVRKDEEIFPVEENRSRGKAQRSNSTPSDARREANGEMRVTEANRKDKKAAKCKHRKSREWWKDEYFAELSSKNGSFQNGKGKRARSMCVDHSGDLNFQGRELKRFVHRSAKEWLTSRSKEWLRGYHSGDLSLSRGRESRSKVPSVVSDFWSGDLLHHQFSGDLLSRQWSGELSKSGELASRDVSSSTSMRGTVCYVPPEYGGTGILSEKGDIYSFGVLMLVILSGRRPIQVTASPMKEFERANLISWARSLSQSAKLLDLMDEALREDYDREQASLCITLALLCLQRVPSRRPNISEVVKILSGETSAPSLPLELSPSPPQRRLYKSPIRPPKEPTSPVKTPEIKVL